MTGLLKKKGIRTQIDTEGRPCVDTERTRPSTVQGETPQKKWNLQKPWTQTPTAELGENKCLWFKWPSVVLCYDNSTNAAKLTQESFYKKVKGWLLLILIIKLKDFISPNSHLLTESELVLLLTASISKSLTDVHSGYLANASLILMLESLLPCHSGCLLPNVILVVSAFKNTLYRDVCVCV